MTRVEFMERLKALLAELPESEREEALQYYNDYFDDAGPENEYRVILELGSPGQVAQKILAEHWESAAEYSERGYEDTRFRDSREIMYQQNRNYERTQENDFTNVQSAGRSKVQKNSNGWKVLAIILLCIFASPIVIPVGLGLLAALIALVLAIVTVGFGILAAGVAVLISGLVVFGVGLAKLFLAPAVGIAVVGTGLLLFALGIVLSLVILWCCVKVIPWFIRGIVKLLRYPFRKAGADK